MLTGRALPIVMVTNDNPLDPFAPIGGSCLRYSTPLACDLIFDLICLTVLGIDRTN